MTENIEIGGRSLPMRRTLSAMRKFDEIYKGDISVLEFGSKPMRVEHVTTLLYLFIEAGHKAEGRVLEVDQEWIEDNAELSDFTTLAERLTSVDDGGNDEEKKT
ncbi:MAG TPA: hypothetical protein VKP88_00615 [Candidatus Paceibacterota bacterium]|nr:hypothetical protein [Candidatus Paceibacterota bacterium]